MLCAPCNRELWIRNRDERARRRQFIVIDPPAPLCHGCYRRLRISKGTRRGKRRYFRFCGPCGRAHRVEQGLPAYRGERGARMWLHEQLRPEEERNRYPWPRSDADVQRPSPFVPMSTLDEVLDDVGALRRPSVMDLVAVHALLHTPPFFKMDAFIYAPAAPTSTALAPSPPMQVQMAPRSTSSPRGPGVQRGREAIRIAGILLAILVLGALRLDEDGSCPPVADGRAEAKHYAFPAHALWMHAPPASRVRRALAANPEQREGFTAVRATGAAVPAAGASRGSPARGGGEGWRRSRSPVAPRGRPRRGPP